MKMPTAIQIAEDLTFSFQSAEDAYAANPQQPVYTQEVVINLIKNWGLPCPDFEVRGLQVINEDVSAEHRVAMRKIGKKIELARKAKKLTIAELAHLMGKPKTTIHRWEYGANIETSNILLIEKFLSVKLLSF